MTERKIGRMELESNNSGKSLWSVVNGKVYDFTSFYEGHPGGEEIMLEYAGKDATNAFVKAKHPQYAID